MKRPNAFWMFFYGRPRRGFPWLLGLVTAAVLVGAIAFRLVGGPDTWRAAFPVFVGALLVGALVFAVVASVRPRKRR